MCAISGNNFKYDTSTLDELIGFILMVWIVFFKYYLGYLNIYLKQLAISFIAEMNTQIILLDL